MLIHNTMLTIQVVLIVTVINIYIYFRTQSTQVLHRNIKRVCQMYEKKSMFALLAVKYTNVHLNYIYKYAREHVNTCRTGQLAST